MPPSRPIGRRLGVAAALLAVLAAGAIGHWRPDQAIRVATGMTSQLLCQQVFVGGLDPQRVYDEEIRPKPGLRPLLKQLRYQIDRQRQDVTTQWAGHFSRTAIFREGEGCRLLAPGEPATTAIPSTPPPTPANTIPIVPGNAGLQAALARAFAEPAEPPYRQVRAIVVLRDGQIIAERYAPGIRPDTPLYAYSVGKSVINALIGILVRERRLTLAAPGVGEDSLDGRGVCPAP